MKRECVYKDGLSLQTPPNPRTDEHLRPTPASWGWLQAAVPAGSGPEPRGQGQTGGVAEQAVSQQL